ncbi:MAG: hypothetical protein R3D90_07685 [Paracoccaceae bacterium]
MMPCDVIRMQMALAFGTLEMQQRMLSGAWQLALWWMPGAAPVLSGKGSSDNPSRKRRAKG